jgi:cytidylate kinase
MTTNAYLVYWCEEGLESVVPITEYEHIDMENTFRVLNDREPVRNPVNTIVQNMVLRAQFNSQRHYELYAIDCDSNITKQDLETMFNDTPQAAADLIRDRGHRLYSNRVERNRVKIV